MSPLTVFVCGATGTQGGATARYLLNKGAEIHALARDPTSEKAKALEDLGVKLWHGDFDNEEALKVAIAGCTAVFLNLMPGFQDLRAETRQTKSIIRIAKDAGVKQFVYSSGFAVDAPEKLEHWDPSTPVAAVLLNKQAVEKLVRDAGFQYWTILRPGNFMANYLTPLVRMYNGLVEHGEWSTALTKDTVLPMVDTVTIGAFTGEAILNPEKFHAQEIEYADEPIAIEELLARLSRAAGRELKAKYMSDEEVAAQKSNPFVAGQLVMRSMVQFLDLEKVKSWGVPLSTFDAFLEREKDWVAETYNKST